MRLGLRTAGHQPPRGGHRVEAQATTIMINVGDPLDGYTVERDGADVCFTISTRYGDVDSYRLTPESAAEVAHALLQVTERAPAV
jgi:hypothetical protein